MEKMSTKDAVISLACSMEISRIGNDLIKSGFLFMESCKTFLQPYRFTINGSIKMIVFSAQAINIAETFDNKSHCKMSLLFKVQTENGEDISFPCGGDLELFGSASQVNARVELIKSYLNRIDDWLSTYKFRNIIATEQLESEDCNFNPKTLKHEIEYTNELIKKLESL